jgi:hypothetical protein
LERCITSIFIRIPTPVSHNVDTRYREQQNFNPTSDNDGDIVLQNSIRNPNRGRDDAESTKRQGIDVRASFRVQQIHENEPSQNGEGYRRVGQYQEFIGHPYREREGFFRPCLVGMCYDAPTSIGTFAFVSAISLFLWRRNGPSDRAIGLILMILVLMQLLEFVLWTHRRAEDVAINQVATTLIPVLLYSQPLLIALVLWQWKAGWFVEAYKYIFYGLLACLPLFIWYLPNLMTAPVTDVGPAGHLAWPIHYQPFLLIAYHCLMAFLILTVKNIPVAIALMAGYGVSYRYYKTYYGKEWSSLWCHAINLVGLVALFP